MSVSFTTKSTLPIIEVTINNHRLECRERIKYLRYDRRLTWNPRMYQTVHSNMNLRKKLMLHNTVLLPLMMYASTFWGLTTKANSDMLRVAQNKLLDGSWFVRIESIRRDFKVDSIR